MVDTDKLFFYEAVTQQLLDDEYVQPTLTTAFHLTRSLVSAYGEAGYIQEFSKNESKVKDCAGRMSYLLEEAVDAIKRQMKVEPNSMLRKDHLYNIFKNCAYLSSRTVVEAELSDEHLDRDKGIARINEIVHEYANLNIEEQYNYKVMAYNNFAEFQNFKVRFKLVKPAAGMAYRNSFRLQGSISRFTGIALCVSQSSDSSLVAIGGVSGSLHVTPFVDTNDPVCKRKPNGMCTSRLHGHSEQVDAIDFHPKRNILASGGIDCNIVLHDINAANGYVYSVAELQRIYDSFSIRSIRFHPCGDFLYAGASNSIIRLYDIASGKCYTSRETFHQHQGGGINSCDVNISGSLLFTAGSDGSIVIWDGRSLEAIYVMDSVHDEVPVVSVKCDPYSRYLLSSGLNGTTKLIDLRMLKELYNFGSERKNTIRTFSTFLSNFQYFIVFSVVSSNKANRSEAIVYSINNGSIEVDITKSLGKSPIWDAAASHDEMSIITVSEDCKYVIQVCIAGKSLNLDVK